MNKCKSLSLFLFFISFFLVIMPSIHASDKKTISLIDAETGIPLGKITAQVTLSNIETGEKFTTLIFSNTPLLEFFLPSQTYSGQIILDDYRTEAVDYYFIGDIFFENNISTVTVIPIAQVKGKVLDSYENLLGNVDLRFLCDKIGIIDFSNHTDKYGYFHAYVPTGECTIYASNIEYDGRTVISVQRGQAIDVTLTLKKNVNKSSTLIYISVIAIFFIFLVAIFFSLNKKKISKQINKPKNIKLHDVIKTLNPKEQSILQFVFDHNNKVSSTTIRQSLAIPKSSLSRLLVHLEEKKIITIERKGRFKHVKITDWLLKK